MTERYVQLTEDLQYAKREAAAWRHKHAQAQIQLQAARDQGRELKRALQGLQETNQKLALANRQLSEDKESMASGYSTEISTIMEEIACKQKEIAQLKDVASPGKLDQQIALRQLKYDLNEEYSQRVLAKQKKLQEVSVQLERATYQREIEREKAKLRIEALEDSLRELQKRHEEEVLDYSTRLYQVTKLTRPNDDKDYLRRVKRENEELRRKLQLSHGELSTALQEKNQVTKDYNRWMNDYQKTIAEHQNELQIYKAEVQRLNDMLENQSARRDEFLLKDRERELKRVRNELQEARDEIVFKDKKVADLELDRVRLLNEIKTARAEREKAGSIIEEQLRNERERLMRELSDARTTVDRMRGQNAELQDKVHDITRISSENARRWETAKGEEQIKNRLKKQRSQQVIPTLDKSIQNIGAQLQQHKGEEKGRGVEDAVSIEKGKVREVLSKYIQAKQRIAQLEKKLQKANDKIVELLQHKAILGSPKATTKHFQFPTDNPPVSPPPHHPHTKPKRVNNQSKDHSASPGKNLHTHTMNQIRSHAKQPMGYTNLNLRREFFSPQDDRLMRIEDEEGNERSYYEKSMKIKNRCLSRELKCINHEE